MGLIEEVKKLKEQGFSDAEIINVLREKGHSPLEIHDALEQVKIKEAVVQQETKEETGGNERGEMQPSIMEKPAEEIRPFTAAPSATPTQPPSQTPEQSSAVKPVREETMTQASAPMPGSETAGAMQTQEAQPGPVGGPARGEQLAIPSATREEAVMPAPGAGLQAEIPAEAEIMAQQQPEQLPEEVGEQAYGYYSGLDYAVLNDMISQVVDEKLEDIRKKFSALNDFRADAETRIKLIEKKLEKLDALMDALQVAVLRRVGDYVADVQQIKKELESMQESFAKILDPLEENIRELKKIIGEKTEKEK